MGDTINEVQATLAKCSDDVCVTVRENADVREKLVQQAQGHVENGEWDEAARVVDEVREIVEGDIERLENGSPLYENEARGGDNILAKVLAPPSGDPLTETERAELVEYLSESPMVGERFTVCLPDAEVPGGNGSIREELTPERLFAYLAGQADDDEYTVYEWGYSRVASENSGDCDDDDPSVRPGAVCGSSPHFVADVSEPVATGGGLLASRGADGHVVVTNTPPTATDGVSAMVCPVEGEPFEPAGLDAWGKTKSDVPVTMDAQGRLSDRTVVQVMVQPPDCPQPIPALLYVSRGLSDGQLIYSGGWVIDDAALYKDSMTALSIAGETNVVGVDASAGGGDLDGDGLVDLVSRAVSSGIDKKQIRRGARIDSGSIASLVKAGVMSEDGGGKLYAWGHGHHLEDGSSTGREDESSDREFIVTHCPLDAPVLHLVNAESASNEVKFKAGAELSKSVN